MEKQRLIWADSLKGWLMVLVVLGHAIQCVMPEGCFNNRLWNIIYSFHMPAFMAISGWFAFKPSKHKGGGNFNIIRRRFCQLIIPFILWTLIPMTLSLNFTLDRFIRVFLYPDTSFWFLWVLFWISVIFTCCRWIASKLRTDELITNMLMAMLLLGIMVTFELRMFGFQFLAYYFVFYVLGYCIHRFHRLRIKKVWIGVVFTAIWAFLAWFWNMHRLPLWLEGIPYVPGALLQYAYRGATALFAVVALLSFSERLFNSTAQFNLVMRWIGTVSLGVYVCHLTILGKIDNMLGEVCTCSVTVNIAVLFVIGLLLSLAIIGLLAKYKLTSKFLLGKL